MVASCPWPSPPQEVKLSAEDVSVGGGKPVALRFVHFQNVSTLSIFIPGNLGDLEETVVSKLVVLGAPIAQEGLKRSQAEQDAARSGDWLGKGIS